MRSKNWTKERRNQGGLDRTLKKIMKCLCSGEQLRGADEMIPWSESLATKDFTESGYSSRFTEADQKSDTGNIEEAELSLRESGSLNYEEARALLGRYEYQKGNVEAALHVFEGIDISAVIPKMKLTLAKRGEHRKRRSQTDVSPPMSMHAASLLMEAIYLKAKTLQSFRKFKEAAQSCKVILDIVESSLPQGLPQNFGADCKLHEIINKAVELLPELWKLSDSFHEAILSYRRALLHHWNLNTETMARIQKEFAVFLLYSGDEASPPNLRSQMEGSFVPRSNMEEAILLLMILLRKVLLRKIEWDPSILDHLTYALSVSGDLRALANQLEELLPEIMDRKKRRYLLALCYYGAGEDFTALNLLKLLLGKGDDPNFFPGLLMAAQICGDNPALAKEGINFARKAIENSQEECSQMIGMANYLLGISLSTSSRSAVADSERGPQLFEAIQALETAGRIVRLEDSKVVYRLALENAEQRKLYVGLYYTKYFIKLEGGCDIKGWLLLARILTAQKRFIDSEIVINAALDQTGKWDQGQLLRTKAKVQIAQGQFKKAIETYTQVLAVLQVRSKNFGSGKKFLEGSVKTDRSLELEVWHDLAHVYISLKQWGDAEICLLKSKAINPYSTSRFHLTGLLQESKGLLKEALNSYKTALDIDPTHVPSYISTAVILRQLGDHSHAVVRSFLRYALRFDRTNHSAWYNLGLLYKDEGSAQEAIECFEAAFSLEETEAIEPFR